MSIIGNTPSHNPQDDRDEAREQGIEDYAEYIMEQAAISDVWIDELSEHAARLEDEEEALNWSALKIIAQGYEQVEQVVRQHRYDRELARLGWACLDFYRRLCHSYAEDDYDARQAAMRQARLEDV